MKTTTAATCFVLMVILYVAEPANDGVNILLAFLSGLAGYIGTQLVVSAARERP